MQGKFSLVAGAALQPVYTGACVTLPIHIGHKAEKHCTSSFFCFFTFSALTILVGRQEGHPVCKKTQWRDAGTVVSGSRCRFAYGPANAG